MVKGIDGTKIKKKTWNDEIERDVELLQGAYLGGTPDHLIEKNKKEKSKK